MLELLREGGLVMGLLYVAAFVATIIFLERLFHLHRAYIKTDDFMRGIYNVVRRGNIVEAVSLCDDTPGPVAHVVRTAVLHHDSPSNEIYSAIEEAGLAEIPRLERNFNLLATIAQISPLLGLLGTVLGLIDVLIAMQQGAPLIQAGDLAGGLWQALLTTAMGLAVAIPSYAGYNFLISSAERIILDMEHASVEIHLFLTKENGRQKE